MEARGKRRVHVGTLNVHMWERRDTYDNNQEQLVALLRERPLDVLGIQESYKAANVLEEVATELGMPHFACGRNLAIWSRFPIAKQRHVKLPHNRELLSVLLRIPSDNGGHDVHMACHVTHLSHVREDRRMIEWKALQRQMYDSVWKGQHVLMGDFNALRLGDYTSAALQEMADVRQANHWEAPVDTLMQQVLWDYDDAADSRKEKERCIPLACVVKRQFCGPTEEEDTEETMVPDWDDTEDSYPLVTCMPILSTCRFGTRIDYVLVSKAWKKKEEEEEDAHLEVVPGSYKVLKMMPATDHNLVTCVVLARE